MHKRSNLIELHEFEIVLCRASGASFMGNPVIPEHGEPRISGILFDGRTANWIVHEVKYLPAMITPSKKIGFGNA